MIVKSGERVEVSGFYKLLKHNKECFTTIQSNRLFFKEKEIAPMTGSCEHIAEWELLESYQK